MTDPAIVELLLDEEDLQLSAGYVNGYDPTNPICGLCGERETIGVVFGVCAKGVTGRLCGDCAGRVGPLGEALVDLVDGLETIACASADPDRRGQILELAVRALQWVQKAAEDGTSGRRRPDVEATACGDVSTSYSASEAGRD